MTNGDLDNAFAISLSLFLIVMTSVILGRERRESEMQAGKAQGTFLISIVRLPPAMTSGTGLPFALAKAGVDPANAGTSIQVIMVRRA